MPRQSPTLTLGLAFLGQPFPGELSLSRAGTVVESRHSGDSDGVVTPGLGGDRRPLLTPTDCLSVEDCHPMPQLVLRRAKGDPVPWRNCPSCRRKRIAALVQWAPLLPPSPTL